MKKRLKLNLTSLITPFFSVGPYKKEFKNFKNVLTVLKEEAEEDALRLAGVGDEEITDGVLKKTKRRFNWLLLNLFTAFLATWVISIY